MCSALFSVQKGHILIFPPKSQFQFLKDQILDICRVLYGRYHTNTLPLSGRKCSYHLIFTSDCKRIILTPWHTFQDTTYSTCCILRNEYRILLRKAAWHFRKLEIREPLYWRQCRTSPTFSWVRNSASATPFYFIFFILRRTGKICKIWSLGSPHFDVCVGCQVDFPLYTWDRSDRSRSRSI